ncbi:MAG TPA: hypothetical protein VFG67_05345 [Oleiagrimonas sp.]|nr:hypothetical protein [Oleiagrimonas sp.]
MCALVGIMSAAAGGSTEATGTVSVIVALMETTGDTETADIIVAMAGIIRTDGTSSAVLH